MPHGYTHLLVKMIVYCRKLVPAKAIVFLFFVLPFFFRNKLGSEDEIKIQLKFIQTIFKLN